MIIKKLTSTKLCCSTCGKTVLFLTIEDVECDYGSHTLIQCPNCEELFSVDGPCNAFSNLLCLVDFNKNLLTKNEIEQYRLSAHSCVKN